jgi:hypothetical protein
MSLLQGRSAFSARSPEAIPDWRMRLLRRSAALLAMTVIAGAHAACAAWGTRNDSHEGVFWAAFIPGCYRRKFRILRPPQDLDLAGPQRHRERPRRAARHTAIRLMDFDAALGLAHHR